MISLQIIAEILNREFRMPFLEKDYVKAQIKKREGGGESLIIRIGRRDIEVDENFNVVGAGTRLLKGVADD